MSRRRVAIGVGAAAVVAIVAALVLRGGSGLVVKAEFADASGLRKDFFVKVGGVPVGRVAEVTLDERDVAVVTMEIDSEGPVIGRDATAQILPSSLLGEHHVEIEPGDVGDPAPTGMVIPRERTSTAVELDQVLAAMDEPTRTALGIFLTESGDSLVGRGGDLAATLRMLPDTLEQGTAVLRELGSDSAALGRLVRASDRVVAPLAREREALGRLVETGDRALASIAAGRDDLGRAIAGGPDAMAQLRTTLRRLRSLSGRLAPAADGLRATAAPLTSMLRELEPFAAAARPSLQELARTAPALRRLARRARPQVRRLRPVADRLVETARSYEPVSGLVDRQTNNVLGFFEGYARSMHRSDSLGHIYNTQIVFENLHGEGGGEGARAGRAGRDSPAPVDAAGDTQARTPGGASQASPGGSGSPPPSPLGPDLPLAPDKPDARPPGGGADGGSGGGGQVQDLFDFLLEP